MKRTFLFLALAWAFAACDKETTISIPDSLDGTTWQTMKEDGSYISLDFDAETYTLLRYAPYPEEQEPIAPNDEERPVETRTYRYVRPNVELLEGSEVILSGEITTDGKSYLRMSLHNADNTFSENLYK